MSRLTVDRFQTAQFSHDKNEKTLTTFASDIQFRGVRRLYNDSCDVGMEIVNSKTNNVTVWYLDEEHRRDGSITHWTFKSVRRSGPESKYTVIIWNT